MSHRYALFFLLRDVGSLTDDFGGFVTKLGAAGSPAYQLKLVNSYRLLEASHPAMRGNSKALHDLDDSCGPIVGDQRSCMQQHTCPSVAEALHLSGQQISSRQA